MTAREFLDEQNRLVRQATDGPWRETFSGSRTVEGHDGQIVIDAFNDGIGAGVIEPGDAEFIAASRSSVPRMTAALLGVLDATDEHWQFQVKRAAKFGREPDCICGECNARRAVEGALTKEDEG